MRLASSGLLHIFPNSLFRVGQCVRGRLSARRTGGGFASGLGGAAGLGGDAGLGGAAGLGGDAGVGLAPEKGAGLLSSRLLNFDESQHQLVLAVKATRQELRTRRNV